MSYSFILIPSIYIQPESTSYNLFNKFIIVVLPCPDYPTNELIVPDFNSNVMLFRTGILSFYDYFTFLNTIFPDKYAGRKPLEIWLLGGIFYF